MDYDGHADAVAREVDGFVDALRAGDLRATVPTCPEWSLRDLAEHVGGFTGFWTHILCEAGGRDTTPYPPMPADGDVADWYATLGRYLVDELTATPADAAAWTWLPADQSARFVARRCANELAVHRFDAQTVSGSTTPIDPALAADGIEEIFMLVNARDGPRDGSGRSLHLHSTDRDDEWTIRMGPDGLDVRREHARADLALVGAVSDLELTLYQRPAIGPVEQHGDPRVLEAWYREFTF